ncbi:MAG: DUF896 domain-containing protein [Lachnospiraceae bacterium]|jgi:uncharacterized protein YnzC (UPF0291/DUF896 family)|nr:DUF896 domain-containing protein [Lachnospiraceae bacterium]MCI8994515.1 DUF896 domain-containing protein [Lachnospiraceae bacterium]MCI9133857.1 DUF896 domain-containing protein [Lachnospiraceae bacterium]
MDEKKIARINELYHKSKAEGLTNKEKQEQAQLRREYIETIRSNLRGQMNQINIQEEDGSITNLGEKFGGKPSKSNGIPQ